MLNAEKSLRSQAEVASSKPDLGDLPEWNLTDLYPSIDSDEVNRDLDLALKRSKEFQDKFGGKLAKVLEQDGGDGLAKLIAEYEEIEELMGRLMSYAGLIYTGDSSDPERAKFYGDVQEKLTAASSHILFFTLELNSIEEDAINAALESSENLARYRPWIVDLRLDKPHQLDDQLEKLFLEKSATSRSAFNRLFDETMSDLRFDVNGEELAIEPTLNLLLSKDGEVRKSAAAALAKTFSKNLKLFTLITNTLAKDREISDRWRGFDDVADSRHLSNRVEGEVVNALADAVQKAFPRLSHRYYALKAKWMGKDVLDHWDRNAPLPTETERVIGWNEARQTVLSAYSGFSPQMAEIADRFFENNWIDAPVRAGKSPGAFAHPTVPSVHPYVLLNFQGKPRDVMTLAHELGHGVHQVLAGQQGALMAQTPLTLAETASVFGEMLTFQSLLNKCETPTERKQMLAQKVEDMINTVVRQIAFYLFERSVHTERLNGELTSEKLCELWMAVQHDSLGPSIRLGEGYETYWTYIPHFIHSPFYVYAYAFGDCLVNSLYAVYRNAESGFQERYFEMLGAGGTKHHSELLAPFGLDASDPAFWEKGLSVIDGFITELEELDAASA
ncbi:MAG: M3 family oligoendopeptidase [Pseudomonadota bacterium]